MVQLALLKKKKICWVLLYWTEQNLEYLQVAYSFLTQTAFRRPKYVTRVFGSVFHKMRTFQFWKHLLIGAATLKLPRTKFQHLCSAYYSLVSVNSLYHWTGNLLWNFYYFLWSCKICTITSGIPWKELKNSLMQAKEKKN